MIVSFPLLVLDSCAFLMKNSDLSMEECIIVNVHSKPFSRALPPDMSIDLE